MHFSPTTVRPQNENYWLASFQAPYVIFFRMTQQNLGAIFATLHFTKGEKANFSVCSPLIVVFFEEI